jgi:chromosome segregation ATPase
MTNADRINGRPDLKGAKVMNARRSWIIGLVMGAGLLAGGSSSQAGEDQLGKLYQLQAEIMGSISDLQDDMQELSENIHAVEAVIEELEAQMEKVGSYREYLILESQLRDAYNRLSYLSMAYNAAAAELGGLMDDLTVVNKQIQDLLGT